MSEKVKEKKKVSLLTDISVVCCVAAIVVLITEPFFGRYLEGGLFTAFSNLVVSAVTGILALINTYRNDSKSANKRQTLVSVVAGSVILIVLIMPSVLLGLSRNHYSARRLICATNIKGLGIGFLLYNQNYDGKIPGGNDWCDLLVREADVGLSSFICDDSDAVDFESSYALNVAVAGKKLSELPGDTVVLFETNYGISEQGRQARADSRKCFELLKTQRKRLKPDMKVYKDRWNQVGGPELLALEIHGNIGGNFLFADYHTEFVRAKDIPNLRWTPDGTIDFPMEVLEPKKLLPKQKKLNEKIADFMKKRSTELLAIATWTLIVLAVISIRLRRKRRLKNQ